MASAAPKASTDDNKQQQDEADEELKDNYPVRVEFNAIQDGSTNHPSYIILLGDSMLDNFYYQMDKKQHSITSLLRKKYFNKAMISNLAVEGCESRHVLYGIQPNEVLIAERKKYSLEPYPVDYDDDLNKPRVYPLAVLEEMVTTNALQFDLPKGYVSPTVILSVGMMDIKSMIPVYDESQVIAKMLSFEKNLRQILKDLTHKFKLNVVLLSLFEPFSDFYSLYETPRDAFVMVLNLWMCKLFTIAAEHKLPIIDLTRTLYTYDRSHYSDKSIFENSSKSSYFIVDLIEHVFQHHVFDGTAPSVIYFGSRSFGGIQAEPNEVAARNTYMQKLKTLSAFKKHQDEEKKNYDDDDGAADDHKKDSQKVEKQTNTENPNKAEKKKEAPAAMKATHIILMGDSVLDNFYWLQDKSKDVKQQLLDTYKNAIKVSNLAVDESTSEDVLYGTDPSWTYVDARKEQGLEPYPIDKNNDGKVEPLKIAKRMIENGEIDTAVAADQIKPTVVLSIGGNDIRVLLFNFNLQTIMDGLDKFVNNAQMIVERVLFELNLNLIPVLCYEPYHDFAAGYGIKREQLLQIFNLGATKIFELAETYALPVIDLSRTFDPFDRSHYGSTSIEPSNKSGQFIVDLIQFINDHFPFNSDTKTSKIYYGLKTDANGIQTEENNQTARDGYMAQLLAKASTTN